MRCADYFARAFASVTTASFQWHNILKENSLTKASEVCGNLMHLRRQCHEAGFLIVMQLELMIRGLNWIDYCIRD
jgi:hypothetical protein